MSALTDYARHCRQMAAAEHKPECPWSQPEKCKPTPRWGFIYGDDDSVTGLGWLGMTEPPPPCDGCVTDDERAMFADLADEADRYLRLKGEV